MSFRWFSGFTLNHVGQISKGIRNGSKEPNFICMKSQLKTLKIKKNEGILIIYSRWWFVMFLPCEINSLNLDLLHRGSLVLLRLGFGCPEWDSAVAGGWSFSVLRVWFHPWPWAHISWNLIQSWADSIRPNAAQTRYCGDLNTEEMLAGDEANQPTWAEAQHRLGISPPTTIWCRVYLFKPGVTRSMRASGCALGLWG